MQDWRKSEWDTVFQSASKRPQPASPNHCLACLLALHIEVYNVLHAVTVAVVKGSVTVAVMIRIWGSGQ